MKTLLYPAVSMVLHNLLRSIDGRVVGRSLRGALEKGTPMWRA